MNSSLGSSSLHGSEIYQLTQSQNWLKAARQQERDEEKQKQIDELDNRIEVLLNQAKANEDRSKPFKQTYEETRLIHQELGFSSKESKDTDFDKVSYLDSRENSLILLENEIAAKNKSVKARLEEKYKQAQYKTKRGLSKTASIGAKENSSAGKLSELRLKIKTVKDKLGSKDKSRRNQSIDSPIKKGKARRSPSKTKEGQISEQNEVTISLVDSPSMLEQQAPPSVQPEKEYLYQANQLN